jgi:hypothetical protein
MNTKRTIHILLLVILGASIIVSTVVDHSLSRKPTDAIALFGILMLGSNVIIQYSLDLPLRLGRFHSDADISKNRLSRFLILLVALAMVLPTLYIWLVRHLS